MKIWFRTNRSPRLCALLCLAALTATLLAGCAAEEFKTYPYSPGEYFVTNVRDSRNYLKAEVVIDVPDSKYIDTLTEKTYVVRSLVTAFLSQQNEAALNDPDAIAILSEELKLLINKELGADYCYKIWFPTFAIQLTR